MATFDEALNGAMGIARSYADEAQTEVTIVRDVLGRISLVVDGGSDARIYNLQLELEAACSPFVGQKPALRLTELFAPEIVTSDPARKPVAMPGGGAQRVHLIERTAAGMDWVGPVSASSGRRVAFYGYKGGVGRSTAVFELARALANEGKRVLVVDLDLESPGVSTMLARGSINLPPYGLVDSMIESAVGSAPPDDIVSRSSTIVPTDSNGEVWFSSAFGRKPGEGDAGGHGETYLDKLGRLYIDLEPAGMEPSSGRAFGARLEHAIVQAEREVESLAGRLDAVLLDCRSGIHDIAAVAITRLANLSLLFAGDNPQTWQGYRMLFARWRRDLRPENLNLIRQRLQVVSALTPAVGTSPYLAALADRAQQVFAATLYDAVPSTPIADGGSALNSQLGDEFYFTPDDEAAPHFPIPIYHNTDLVGTVPGIGVDSARSRLTDFVFADFVSRVSDMMRELSNE